LEYKKRRFFLFAEYWMKRQNEKTRREREKEKEKKKNEIKK